MNRKLSTDERAICAGICGLAVFGIYLYVKFTMPLYWPFTWIDSLMLTSLKVFLYAGLPLASAWALFLIIRSQYRSDIKKYCETVIKEMRSLEWRFGELEKSAKRRVNALEDEIKALRKELEKNKEAQEARHQSIESTQDQALKNFL